MAAIAPGDIVTQPDKKICFNAPFTEKNAYNMRLLNNGAHRIGWAIKTTNVSRLAVDPPCGVLDTKVRVCHTWLPTRAFAGGGYADGLVRAVRLRRFGHKQ
jgi:hypothetical protein